MPNITLETKVYNIADQITVQDLCLSLKKDLNNIVAAYIDNQLVDLSFKISTDAEIKLVSINDKIGVEVLRHSTAHLLAQAVKSLWPKAQVTIGPVIQDGFYYDFAFERPFTVEDLEIIEKKMHELAAKKLSITRSVIERGAAIKFFHEQHEDYKVQIIEDLPEATSLSFYKQDDFIDLCRGPHVPNTDYLKHFKLLKVAGAYWRGDAKNPMLYRIYGTAWASKEDLDAYLYRQAEAEKRDHRKLGTKYNLFHQQDLAPGMVFWHPHGWILYQVIEQYMRQVWLANGYLEVRTPQLVDKHLWELSGHWQMFQDNMFVVNFDEKVEALKPMNCPCHIQIFKQGLTSYKELPIRLAEFGVCHRCEPSGALHGLLRTRGFVQDDAHIFCMEEQIQAEVSRFIDLLFSVYQDFGFDKVLIKLATRPDVRIGSDEIWDKAEEALAVALSGADLSYELCPKEGAFYGPKIEFHLYDSLDRVWQCGTIQVDFSMPERLGAYYMDEASNKRHPVMLHRVILGSLERFIGILIEDTAGKLPMWLAPVQVMVLSITDNQHEFCLEIKQLLVNKGFRVSTDLRNEKIGFKIREHTIQNVPYLIIIGNKEVQSRSLSVRSAAGVDLGAMDIEQFALILQKEVLLKRRKNYQ